MLFHKNNSKALMIFWALSGLLWNFSANSTNYEDLSTLEKKVVDSGLKKFELTPTNETKEKIIDEIFVITDPPFFKENPWMDFLNNFHMPTKEYVLKREIFQSEAGIFNDEDLKDSERALRRLSNLRTVAVIVPVKKNKNHKHDHISLLVATKDTLGFRPSFGFEGSSFGISNFLVGLGQHNLFGLNKSILAQYERTRLFQGLSAQYFDPQFLNTKLSMNLNQSIIFNISEGSYDGMSMGFSLKKPLISQNDWFGYGVKFSYGSKSIVNFIGENIRTIDIPTTKKIESIEHRYRYGHINTSVYSLFSFGKKYKKEFSIGYKLLVQRPSLPKDMEIDQEQQGYLIENILPKNGVESFLTTGFSFFHNDFLILYDYEKFKLQEIKRMGPNLSLALDVGVKKFLLSDEDFIRPKFLLSITKPINKEGFIVMSAFFSTKYNGKFRDISKSLGFSFLTPKLYGLARIVFDAKLSFITDGQDNNKFSLGLDSGLRGAPSSYYLGDIGFKSNLEVRSLSFSFASIETGIVAFYDMGSAFDILEKASINHSLGLGIRVLIPSISNEPFRFDLAYSFLGNSLSPSQILPSFGMGQAF